jgi:hypothetical protein
MGIGDPSPTHPELIAPPARYSQGFPIVRKLPERGEIGGNPQFWQAKLSRLMQNWHET